MFAKIIPAEQIVDNLLKSYDSDTTEQVSDITGCATAHNFFKIVFALNSPTIKEINERALARALNKPLAENPFFISQYHGQTN